MKRPTLPRVQGQTAASAFELMAFTRSGISPRLLAHAAARRHRRDERDPSLTLVS